MITKREWEKTYKSDEECKAASFAGSHTWTKSLEALEANAADICTLTSHPSAKSLEDFKAAVHLQKHLKCEY